MARAPEAAAGSRAGPRAGSRHRAAVATPGPDSQPAGPGLARGGAYPSPTPLPSLPPSGRPGGKPAGRRAGAGPGASSDLPHDDAARLPRMGGFMRGGGGPAPELQRRETSPATFVLLAWEPVAWTFMCAMASLRLNTLS
jgi:hypothetical protein